MHGPARTALLLLSTAILINAAATPVAAQKAAITGSFGNCDAVIHDKLVGAEWRSPSECEVKFDAYVRQGLTAALQPAIDALAAQGWQVSRQVESQSLTSIPRHTETKPFQMTEQQMHQGGAFFVSLRLPESSPIYQRYNQAAMDAMQKVMAAVQAGKNPQMEAANDAARVLGENTTVEISVAINLGSQGMSNFKTGHTVKPLPGGGYTVEVPYTQAPTGGDITASQRVTFVFLGAWAAAPTSRASGEGEEIQVKGNLSLAAADLMKVQNVRIRIQGGTGQAQQVLRTINWNALQQLMAGK